MDGTRVVAVVPGSIRHAYSAVSRRQQAYGVGMSLTEHVLRIAGRGRSMGWNQSDRMTNDPLVPRSPMVRKRCSTRVLSKGLLGDLVVRGRSQHDSCLSSDFAGLRYFSVGGILAQRFAGYPRRRCSVSIRSMTLWLR